MSSEFSGRIALVTGASRGIGRAAAVALGQAGAHVILLARTVGGLEEADDEILRAGGKATLIPADLSDFAAIDQLGPAIGQRFGRVDILVVASGKNDVSKITDMAPARFLDVMDANVTQSWLMARAATAQMLRQGQGGKIVLVSSARGTRTT